MTINPFCPVKAAKTARFYIFWAVSFICAPVIVPLRIAALLFICTWHAWVMRLMSRGLNMKKPLNPIRYSAIHSTTQLNSRFFMFALGVRLREIDVQKRPSPYTTSVLVFNHTSSLDPVLLYARGFVSFVSKSEVARMPVFGVSAKANQCIFYERSREGENERVFDEIQQRLKEDVHEWGYPQRFPPLCISPEGTVCNGCALLPFKRGAFASGKPVQMCAIQWDSSCGDVCDSCISKIRIALKLVFGLFYTVTVQWMGEYIPNADEVTDCALYAEGVRECFCQQLKVPKSDFCAYDKQYYARRSSDYARCSQTWKEAYGKEYRFRATAGSAKKSD